MNKHRWINTTQDTRRCTYCDIPWHPSRENKECQAQFPIPEDKHIYAKDDSVN